VNYQGSIDYNKFFVSLHDIYPTQIATIPFYDREHSMTSRISEKFPVKFVKKRTGSAEDISYFVMLKLQPENLSLYIDSRTMLLQK
jgi:hypothetical protein